MERARAAEESLYMPLSVKKRMKEKARQEKQQNKAQTREQRKREKDNRAPVEGGAEDPDIAGIIPGPQPIEEY
jgi:hypothetical protein